MQQILIIREHIVGFIKRFEIFILPIVKFLAGLYVFSAINRIGYAHPAIEYFAEAANMLVVLFAILVTVMPMNLSWILIILNITAQFTGNIEIAIVVFLFLIFIFLFYARMAAKESLLIIFTIMAFHFNIPYIIPLIVGLYFPVSAIIPVTIGVFINTQIPALFDLSISPIISPEMEMTEIITEFPAVFSEIYTTLLSTLTDTNEWIFTAVIFAMVIILVHIVSRLAVDFAREIAILLGTVVSMFGFIVVILVADSTGSIGMVVLGAIVSGILAVVVTFFHLVLDYQRVENVQFEDDDNYYNVRIIPKIIATAKKKNKVEDDFDEE